MPTFAFSCADNSMFTSQLNVGRGRSGDLSPLQHALNMRQARNANSQVVLCSSLNMQSDTTLSHSAPTFVRLLKECAKLKDLERGTEIHAEVARKGLLDKNIYIGTTLVDMYAKCGLLIRAQQVFDKLPERNVVSWTTLIGGYADNDRSEEALWYFERMQEEGTPTDLGTFICCLKACRTIHAIEKGQAIHSEIERQGLLETDLRLANSLVDMYVKCGQLDDAHYVLRKLRVCNVITWTALISGYVDHGHYEKALDCFEKMQKEGVPPAAATYVTALKACGVLGNIHKGQALHNIIKGSGLLEENFLLGSSVVSMYSKCGLLAKAQQVFDRLAVRNISCWNSLLGAYVEHGRDEAVLKCHEQMKLEGVSPNFVTFICTLKACGNIKDAVKGGEIHEEVRRQGMQGDPVLANALVDMYAKSGLLLIARQVFDNLCVQTIAAWNALIAGYAEHGQGRTALDCFEQMQIEGVFPMPATFICALKACSSTKNTLKGGELHAEIERQSLLDSNIVIGNTLVDMYAKLCMLPLSQEVFDRLPVRDVVTWSVLIGGYTDYGLGEEALKQFQLMQHDGVAPNAVTYSFVLKACCILRIFAKGQEIHAEIERQGLLKSNALIGSTLIDLYSKCGSIAKAEEVFNKLPAQSTASWNALIEGYAEHGDGEMAIQCIEQMQQEGFSIQAGTFVCGLKACSSIGSIGVGDKLYAAIEQSGMLDKDAVLGSTLVDMYTKCSSLEKAQQVFEKLLVRGVVVWTTLIAGYTEHGDAEEALRLFEQMCIEGVPRDAFTLVCGLKACGKAGTPYRGKQIHAEIEEQKLLAKDLVVGNALVDMYARCGLLATAQEVFKKLPAQSVISWTSLIAGYANYGYDEEALKCLEKMQLQGFSPNLVTYVCSLKACASIGSIETGSKLHSEIERQGLWERDLTVGNAVVDMYARCGRLVMAQQVFDKLPVRTTVTWTTIMAGYAHVGEGGKVFHFLKSMLEEGSQPNEVTFVVLLTACIRMGLFNKGVTFFEAMSRDYGIVPILEHYTCVVSLLGQAGHLDRALSMSKKLSKGMDFKVQNGVLFSCKSWGNVGFGKRIFEQPLHAEQNEVVAEVAEGRE